MLRPSLALILICASVPAIARDGREMAADACQVAQVPSRASVEESSAAPPKSAVTRSKYAKPAAAPSGGGGDEVLPRPRGSKWHSYLPGMFR